MATLPKFTHLARPSQRRGESVRFTLCGRRVGVMSLTSEAKATCSRCVAESLAKGETAQPVATR